MRDGIRRGTGFHSKIPHPDILKTEYPNENFCMKCSKSNVKISIQNSTVYILQRVLRLRAALVPAIANCPDLDVDLSNLEFALIEKVCKILTFFEQATKMMSEGDASISLSIPVVTTIMVSSNNKKGQDLGVIQLKNGLSDAMDRRFICLVSY